MLYCPKRDLKWVQGEERMAVMFNFLFSFVLFSFKLCSYFQESNKENSDFSIFGNIRVIVTLETPSPV